VLVDRYASRGGWTHNPRERLMDSHMLGVAPDPSSFPGTQIPTIAGGPLGSVKDHDRVRLTFFFSVYNTTNSRLRASSIGNLEIFLKLLK
jgi:hypothetical protein